MLFGLHAAAHAQNGMTVENMAAEAVRLLNE